MLMLSTAKTLICRFVEAMLPTGTRKVGLRMVLKCELDFWSDQFDIHQSRELELLFYRPTNYTKVFGRRIQVRVPPPEIWEKFSDHDSCWRDEALNKVDEFFYREMLAPFTDKGIGYPDIHQNLDISIFDGGPEYIEVLGLEPQDKEQSYSRIFKVNLGNKVDHSKFLRAL